MFALETERLLIRAWEYRDRGAFAAMNADPEVMEFFPSVLTSAESDDLVDRFEAEFEEVGYCPWVVEERAYGGFVGFVGLHEVPGDLPCAPAVEVGWRLARPYSGRGYATEAASVSLAYAFGTLGVEEVVSMTSVVNGRSRRVMERLGMRRDPVDDFAHPRVAEGSPLRPHVLYRIAAPLI